MGHRLALLAEHYVYGDTDLLCEAPTLTALQVEEGKAILHFDHAGDGLYLSETVPYGQRVGADTVGGLELFQEGKKADLSGAKVEVAGKQVTLQSPSIRACLATKVSLAETGWYLVNLYNSAGIPARPSDVEILPS